MHLTWANCCFVQDSFVLFNMIFNLNLFFYLLVYLPPGFYKLKTTIKLRCKYFEGMVFIPFQFFYYVLSIYIKLLLSIYIKLQQFWEGQIFCDCNLGVVRFWFVKCTKYRKKKLDTTTFHSLYPKDSKNV